VYFIIIIIIIIIIIVIIIIIIIIIIISGGVWKSPLNGISAKHPFLAHQNPRLQL